MNWINSKLKKTYFQGTIILTLFIIIFFVLGLHKVFFLGPHGIHFMRQTDSLSFASNYFNNGFSFFKPQLFNLKNIDGKAACEFPISYYLTAIAYSIFGKHLFIQKLIHLIIIYFGIYSIFKLAKLVLKDFFYSVLISLIVFTSTVFNYYSFNYLPDIPALGFTFLGWYFIYKFQTNNKTTTIILSFLFFTLGSLIKVTYLLNPIAVVVLSLFSIVFYKKKPLIPNSKKIVLYGLISLAIVLLWNVYILYYNNLNNSNSFNTRALPIWILNQEKINRVWDHISNYWYNKYFSEYAFRLIYAVIILQLILIKKSTLKYSLQILILFLGSLAYFILFYTQFQDHDYYFLAFFPLVILILINGIKILQNTTANYIIHSIAKLILLVVIISGIKFSRNDLQNRLTYRMDDYSRTGLLVYENLGSIEKLNIDDKAKFIVAPDLCQNGGLFFLNKFGWTIENSDHISAEKILEYKMLGASYLVDREKPLQFLSN